MTVQDRDTLKGYFSGSPVPSVPSINNYIDLIDSMELVTGTITYTAPSTGWYRIAKGQSLCAQNVGVFTIASVLSGKHNALMFSGTITFGTNQNLNIISHSSYGGGSLTLIRLLYLSTYDQPFIEVYLNSGSIIKVKGIGLYGWEILDPIIAGSIPSGYSTLSMDITSKFLPDAGTAPWTGISGKPSTFAPSAHTHAGGDITSAVANASNAVYATSAGSAGDADMLDGLPPSTYHKTTENIINSHNERIGGGITIGTTGSDLASAGQVVSTGDMYPNQNEAGLGYRHNDGMMSIQEHFDVAARPAGWSLYGSHSDSYSSPSLINLTGATGVSFLYKTLVSTNTYFACFSMRQATLGNNMSVRLELGTDVNYYVQGTIEYSAYYQWIVKGQYRQGAGDSVHEANGATLYGNPFPIVIGIGITGTRWSSWGYNVYIGALNSNALLWSPNAVVSGLTWTPTRMGVKVYSNGGAWEGFYTDFFTWI